MFENLKPDNLPQLSWWIHASSKLVIDAVRAKEFSDKVAALGKTTAGHTQ